MKGQFQNDYKDKGYKRNLVCKMDYPLFQRKVCLKTLETRDEQTAELKLHQFKLENGQLIHNSNIKLSDLYSKYFSLYTEYGKKAKYELYPLRFFIEYLKKMCSAIQSLVMILKDTKSGEANRRNKLEQKTKQKVLLFHLV